MESLCLVCVWVCVLAHKAQTNGFNPSTNCMCVCLKALCPCCDIIYECHNWGSVNCRFSPLSVTPCVNTEVQGDGADQYSETGAIRWIYSPVTREQRNDAAVAFSKLLDETAALLASICQTCTPVILRGILCSCCCFGEDHFGLSFASVTAVGRVLVVAVKELLFGWIIGLFYRRYFDLS